jgi:hypothetical protein
MHVAIDFDKGTATMTISQFWSGLNELLAQADTHPIGSRDEDSGHLHRDRDACLIGGHLEIGKPLWPLIERDCAKRAGDLRPRRCDHRAGQQRRDAADRAHRQPEINADAHGRRGSRDRAPRPERVDPGAAPPARRGAGQSTARGTPQREIHSGSVARSTSR